MIDPKLLRTLSIAGALVGAVTVAFACNSGVGSCPDKTAISAGASCSDDNLQCPYDLATPNPSCDGTNTTIETSCTCTSGTWVCPDAVECPAAEDGGDEAATDDDGGATDDGAVTDDGGGDGASDDAADAGDAD
jgi:hypothetical protein